MKFNDGVSDIITAILLISLVVSGMTVVAVFVSTIPAETKEVPEISLQVCQDPGDIVLYHDGGDTLKSDEFLVNILDSERKIIATEPGFEWSVGKKDTVPYPSGSKYVQFVSTEGGGDRLIAWSSISPCTGCSIDASFTASPQSGEPPLDVIFTDTSSGNITSWEWDCNGDGTVDFTGKGPHTYTYTSEGAYNAQLLVTTDDCGSKTVSKRITVRYCVPPTASFTASPTSGPAPLSVTFTDTSSEATSWQWDFGDGQTAAGKGPHTHLYPYRTTPYYVTLTVTNACGSDTTDPPITITSNCVAPTAVFSAAPASGETPLDVTFNDESTGTVTNWEWDFGDGGTATGEGPHTHQYLYRLDPYVSTLTVTGPCGSHTTTRTIEVYPEGGCTDPIAAFSPNPSTGYAPLFVTFTDSSTGTIASSNWDFGDGQTATGTGTKTHTYTTPAMTYVARLTVSGCNTNSTYMQSITTLACTSPVAAFSSDPSTGYAPLVVTFHDESTGPVTNWMWDFNGDDAADSTVQNPSPYTYTSPGTYNAELTVDGPCGTHFVVHQVSVNTCTSPDAAFNANPTSGYAPLEVAFTDASLGTVTEWQWDFNGDGTVDSTVQNPGVYTYNSAGTYNAKLTVTGPCGEDTITQEIIVSTCIPPVASLTASLTSGDAPLDVTFTDASTGTITAWSWDFDGDGTIDATGPGSKTYSYNAAGTYDAKLTVTGPCGESTFTQEIIVTCTPPAASFTASPVSGIAPLAVTFIDASTGTITTWEWDFNGDGEPDATGSGTKTYTYTTTGTYNAALTVTGPCGTHTAYQQIVVTTCTAPVAFFTADPTSGYAPLDVTFTDSSTGTITVWEWDFQDDGTIDSTEQNPLHTYSSPGTYDVNLTVKGPCGTSSTINQIVVTDCNPGIRGDYYPTRTFTGTPVSRVDSRLRLADAAAVQQGEVTDETNWPQATLGKQDQFSCDYQGTLLVPTTGTYTFTLRSDDGSYLWIDDTDTSDTPVVDNWGDHAPQNRSASLSLTQGIHPIRVRMYENSGRAVLALFWSGPGFSTKYVDSFCLGCTPPAASFTASPTTGYAPLAVTFTDSSTGSVSSYEWAFGDGQTATGIGPHTHTYTTAGTYTAQLTVTGICGTSTATQQIVVSTCTPPAASFTASPTSGYAPLTVTFTDTSTGTISTWWWDFNGDGTIDATGSGTKSYTYTTAGTYNANLTVAGPCGTSTATREIVVSTCISPTAAFTASPTTGKAPLAVTFTDGSTGTITSWEWDFNGDGTVDATGIGPHTYIYTTTGTYTAKLTVTGPCGTSTKTQQIIVTPCQYTITASAGTGGYISPSGSVVVPCGESRTFTITANWGYVIDDVIVDGVSQGILYSYTFTNVQADHTIQAVFTSWADYCSISGYVRDDSTNAGVPGIRVEIWNDARTTLLRSGITQADGFYAINHPDPSSSQWVDAYCPDQGTWYTTFPASPRGWIDHIHINPGRWCSVSDKNFRGHFTT